MRLPRNLHSQLANPTILPEAPPAITATPGESEAGPSGMGGPLNPPPGRAPGDFTMSGGAPEGATAPDAGGRDPDEGLVTSRPAPGAPGPRQPTAESDAETGTNSDEEMNDAETSAEEAAPAPQPTTNASGGIFTINPPPRRNPQGLILSTPFAPTYRSTFILEPHGQRLLPLLKHLNCSYLSTRGVAPTLLELKQHAQSLTILIKHLTISTKPGMIDNVNAGLGTELGFVEGETYDWLNDLRTEYTGPKNPALAARHQMPLGAVLNTLEHYDVENPTPGGPPVVGVRDICPLHYSSKAPVNGPSLPYATHQALISHANEVLELLDHEYSATGGLLSILPAKDQKLDREKAEATLLGQLILYSQRLVERLHTLERLYANSLDILASESLVPSQTLSRLGPSGRKGRELVYPQDRFVLVNAGDDVWNFLDKEFMQKERTDEKVEEMYKGYGVVGEEIWAKKGKREMDRGVTAIDVVTRYYRLRKDPLKTIFVIPAHQVHPGVKATREMEKVPTVVSVVKPVWPERASMWEMKHRSDLEDLKKFKRENSSMTMKVEHLEEEKKLLLYDNKLKDGLVRNLQRKLTEMETITIPNSDIDAERLKLWEQLNSINAQRQEAQDFHDKAEKDKEFAEKEKKAVKEERETLEQEKRTFSKLRRERVEREKGEFEKREKAVADADAENARAGTELERKLKSVWRQQILETQVVLEWLKKRRVDYENDVISQDIEDLGEQAGEDLLADAGIIIA